MVCRFCGAETKRIGAKNCWELVQCESCKLQQVSSNHEVPDLSEIYVERLLRVWKSQNISDFYKKFNSNHNNPKRDQFAKTLRQCEYIDKREVARFLDYGCGRGALVNWFSSHCGHAVGVEAHEDIAQYLKGLGNEVVTREEALRKYKSYFDLIQFEHSFEHVLDIQSAISDCKKLLASGGYVYIIAPNHDCHAARKQGVRWYNYSPPHHIYFFTEQTLRTVCEESNLEVVSSGVTCNFSAGIWIYYSLDRWLNFFIRLLNNIFDMKRKQFLPENRYPESVLEYFRLLPYYINIFRSLDQEVYVLARFKNE